MSAPGSPLNLDRKRSRSSHSGSSSHGMSSNVVDHLAPGVTEHVPALPRHGAEGTGTTAGRRGPPEGKIITVQPLKKDEMQPSYAQDLGVGVVEHGIYGSCLNALGACIGFCGAFPCCPFPNPFREVNQGSVGLVSRFGQFYKAVDPGLVQVNVCTESLKIVDVKIQIASIGRQTVITRDNVNVEIDSVIYFQITNPYRAAFGINDLRLALIERAQTTLRHVVGARPVQAVVTDRETIAFEISEIVGEIAEKWGVLVESILIKDIIFSPEVAASLSSAAQQKRLGESKVIAARAEVDAARLMRQAADILASKPAMQIRQLEALQVMAKSANSKVIFVPMSLVGEGSSGGMFVNEGTSAQGGGGAGPLSQTAILNSLTDV